MKLPILQTFVTTYKNLTRGFWSFLAFFARYLHRKVILSSIAFEKYKNKLVKLFMAKRGRYNRPFLHFATMAVLFVGVLVGPFLAETYPVFSSNASSVLGIQNDTAQQSILVGENVFETQISDKPRDQIINYTVQKGDTISTIAQKFQIDSETIKWSNDMSSDSLTVGETLKILPVSGVAHKVADGDTVYTIAKKYDTEAQKIVDFPFNDFANPETFALVEGQMLIVPDGVEPSEQPTYIRRQPTYVATGPVTISASGFTWPLRGGISQFASWYHMALDITSPVGTPVVAAHNGAVSQVNIGTWDGGYGTNVYVTDANGMGSHYAHLSSVNVSAGQEVYAGKTVIGWVGMTGRTTGPHLHFEISQNGSLINPLNYLK